MNALLKKHWPVFIVIGVYWATVVVLVIFSIQLNGGHLIYPRDDTYIHMSMAKNAVMHHIWGMTRYEFTSSTSSPLWTFLLAIVYSLFGINDGSPLVLNVVFGTLTIIASYLFLAKYIPGHLRTFAILLAAILVTPLPSLTLIGMEHVLHALLSLCFVYLAVRSLSPATRSLQRYYVLLLVLSPFIVEIRYEGMFLVFVVCSMFLFQRKIFHAIILGITALLPMVLYGIWSIAHGWYFFPNSVLLKTHLSGATFKGIIKQFGFGMLRAIHANGHILILFAASLSLLGIHYLKKKKISEEMKYANLIFAGSLFLQLQFAKMGSFTRYEAYLVLLGFIVVASAANELLPKRIVWLIDRKSFMRYTLALILMVVIATPFVSRMLRAIIDTPLATNNIYEQQYQMGTFLKKFYQGKPIAVNDIGAVTYLADIRLIDLYGLGTLETARLKLHGNYTASHIYDVTRQRGATIAIIYDNWLESNGIGGVPRQWVRTGQWTIPRNVICGGETVSFYAVDPAQSDELMRNLIRFAGELPADIKQCGMYTQK